MKSAGSELISILLDSLPAICLGVFGGFSEMMLRSDRNKLDVRYVIASLVVAGFIGMLVSLLLYDHNISPALHGAAVGVAGASSRTIMEVLQKWGMKIIEKLIS